MGLVADTAMDECGTDEHTPESILQIYPHLPKEHQQVWSEKDLSSHLTLGTSKWWLALWPHLN